MTLAAKIATLIDCAGMARRMAAEYMAERREKDAARKIDDARWYLRLARDRNDMRSAS